MTYFATIVFFTTFFHTQAFLLWAIYMLQVILFNGLIMKQFEDHNYFLQLLQLGLLSWVAGLGSQYWVHRKEMELFILQDKSEKERANMQSILQILPESVMFVSESEKVDENPETPLKNHEEELAGYKVDEERP